MTVKMTTKQYSFDWLFLTSWFPWVRSLDTVWLSWFLNLGSHKTEIQVMEGCIPFWRLWGRICPSTFGLWVELYYLCIWELLAVSQGQPLASGNHSSTIVHGPLTSQNHSNGGSSPAHTWGLSDLPFYWISLTLARESSLCCKGLAHVVSLDPSG